MSHRANVNNTMKNTQNQELPPVAVGSIDLLDDLPGALLLAKGVAEQKWPHTVDARAWADGWLRTLKEHPDIATDRDTMIGWFANSIMAGYDTGYYAGYYDHETRERVERLFNCTHPIFGDAATHQPTAEESLNAGLAMGREV